MNKSEIATPLPMVALVDGDGVVPLHVHAVTRLINGTVFIVVERIPKGKDIVMDFMQAASELLTAPASH